MSHSQLPWVVEGNATRNEDGTLQDTWYDIIPSGDGWEVCGETGIASEPNADFIVKAANSYYQMKKALSTILDSDLLSHSGSCDWILYEGEPCNCVIAHAREAINKVEGRI